MGLFLVGCDGGATHSSLSVDGVGSEAWDFTEDGPMVAKVRLAAPASESFILRATVPVPPGTFRANDPLQPLAVLSSSDPTASPSQVEVVSRYADSADGADVVEVMSRVRRPNVPVGTPIEYEIVYHPHAPESFELAGDVARLLRAPDALTLEAGDVFGHRYRMDLFEAVRAGDFELARDGALVREFEVAGALAPMQPTTGAQATLPRMMGVHAFVRTFDEEDFFALDLHFHNGFDGFDETTPLDDVLDELYFDRLSLRLPAGWEVLHAAESPFTGEPVAEGGMQRVDLVAEQQGNFLHYMRRQSQFWRRVMVARTPAAAERAREILEHRTLAFVQDGNAPSGDRLWSWWNPETSRYLPQRHVLPDLSAMTTREDVEANYASSLALRLDQVQQGFGNASPVNSPGLGWAHPWGVGYGGMTGGEDIMQFVGVDVAWAASQSGYRFFELKARMRMDRQPDVFYRADGEPMRYEDFARNDRPHSPYLPVDFSMRPLGNNDFFGFNDAPRHQIEAAIAQGRVAPYKAALDEFHAIDLQHHTRYTQNLFALAWLGNDSLAKSALGQATELFRITHSEAYRGTTGYVSGNSLLGKQQFVANHPGAGVAYGRGEGWGLLAASAMYGLGDDELRERYRPWLRSVAETVAAGQSTCTGNITAVRINKVLNGEYRSRQSFELSFVITGLESMRRSVFEGADPATFELLANTIVGASYSTVQAPFWDAGLGGQRRIIGVGRSDMQPGDFCASIPTVALYNETNVDRSTPLAVWAYAFNLTQDGLFLQRASETLAGGGNLMSALEQQPLNKLSHSAGLLAALQQLGTP